MNLPDNCPADVRGEFILFKVSTKMKAEVSTYISEQLATEAEWNYLIPGLPKSERVEIIDTLYTGPTVAWLIDFGEFYICYNKSQQIKGLLAFISPNTNLNVQYSSMSALWSLPKLGLGLPKVTSYISDYQDHIRSHAPEDSFKIIFSFLTEIDKLKVNAIWAALMSKLEMAIETNKVIWTVTSSRDKRAFLEENHFDLHNEVCLTKAKEDPTLYVLAWEPVFSIINVKPSQPIHGKAIEFLAQSMAFDPKWAFLFTDASKDEILNYLKDLYIKPSLEWLLANGQVFACQDCSGRVRGVLAFSPANVTIQISWSSLVTSGLFSLGSLGLSGSWKLTNYLQAQTALVNKESKSNVVVHFISTALNEKREAEIVNALLDKFASLGTQRALWYCTSDKFQYARLEKYGFKYLKTLQMDIPQSPSLFILEKPYVPSNMTMGNQLFVSYNPAAFQPIMTNNSPLLNQQVQHLTYAPNPMATTTVQYNPQAIIYEQPVYVAPQPSTVSNYPIQQLPSVPVSNVTPVSMMALSQALPSVPTQPVQQQLSQEEVLPFGWEKRLDHVSGIYYYLDHQSQTTHWTLPASAYTNPSAGVGGPDEQVKTDQLKQELLQFQRSEEEKRLRDEEKWKRDEEARMVEFQKQKMQQQRESEEKERREKEAEKERAREQREREQQSLQAKLLAEQQEREARIVQAQEQQIQEKLRQEQMQEQRKKEEQMRLEALKEREHQSQELSLQQERFEREKEQELQLEQQNQEKSSNYSSLGYTCDSPAARASTSMKGDMIQAKAFVNWVNYVLKGTGKSMTDLSQFSDGEIIIDLVENLCGTVMDNKIFPVQSTHQKMQNLSNALKFFAATKHVALSSFSIPMIISKNSKILCDLAWELAYYSTIQPITYCGLTDRFALLFWLKQCVSTYQNVNIENFTGSWSDGLGLSALVHSIDPSLIDYYNLQEYAKTQNLRQALDAASLLSIPRLVDATDLLENPEEICVILYLAHFFHKFHQDTH